MVTKDRCMRLEKALLKNADPAFLVTENYQTERGCNIDFINNRVSDQLTSDELQDSYAHIGSIGYSEDKGYKSEFGKKSEMLEGDVPVYVGNKWFDPRPKGRGLAAPPEEARLWHDLESCGCENITSHEHRPAVHVHFECRTPRSIVCATKNALKES